MAIGRETSDCLGMIERLRKAPELQWAKTHYTTSGIHATVVDARTGVEYDLDLRPKDDQWPRPITERTTVFARVTEFDRQQFLVRSECLGCGHVAHPSGECRQHATFSKEPCGCDFHEGEQP